MRRLYGLLVLVFLSLWSCGGSNPPKAVVQAPAPPEEEEEYERGFRRSARDYGAGLRDLGDDGAEALGQAKADWEGSMSIEEHKRLMRRINSAVGAYVFEGRLHLVYPDRGGELLEALPDPVFSCVFVEDTLFYTVVRKNGLLLKRLRFDQEFFTTEDAGRFAGVLGDDCLTGDGLPSQLLYRRGEVVLSYGYEGSGGQGHFLRQMACKPSTGKVRLLPRVAGYWYPPRLVPPKRQGRSLYCTQYDLIFKGHNLSRDLVGYALDSIGLLARLDSANEAKALSRWEMPIMPELGDFSEMPDGPELRGLPPMPPMPSPEEAGRSREMGVHDSVDFAFLGFSGSGNRVMYGYHIPSATRGWECCVAYANGQGQHRLANGRRVRSLWYPLRPMWAGDMPLYGRMEMVSGRRVLSLMMESNGGRGLVQRDVSYWCVREGRR